MIEWDGLDFANSPANKMQGRAALANEKLK
jgi:hypothetical protein